MGGMSTNGSGDSTMLKQNKKVLQVKGSKKGDILRKKADCIHICSLQYIVTVVLLY